MPVANLLDVAPAPREAWRPGLRNVSQDAGILVDVPEDFGGVEYSPLTRGVDQQGAYDPCSDIEYEWASREGTIKFVPWAIYAWEDCPVLGSYNVADLVARATDKLTRQTSHIAEQVFWTGDIPDAPAASDTLEELGTASGADNRRLASSAATLIDGAGQHDITDAFGHIYEFFQDTIGGERGWIHVSADLLPLINFYGLGVRQGRVIDTMLGDHRIVAGTGYDGSGPPGTSTGSGDSWIYATTPVRFFQSPILNPTDEGQLIWRDINRFRVAASRLVLAEWDLTVHGAIKVCTPGPGPECGVTGS